MQTLHRAEASSNLGVENPRPEVSDFARRIWGLGSWIFREGWVSEIAFKMAVQPSALFRGGKS